MVAPGFLASRLAIAQPIAEEMASQSYRKAMPAPRQPLSRVASQRGSMLIEVLVGTLLLAFATTAVLEGLDSAQRTGG